jgi:type I restriction enzyme R subunit
LKQLNQWLDDAGAARVLTTLTRGTGIDLTERNMAVHTAISRGVTAPYTDEAGRRRDRSVRLIDYDEPSNNNFEFARQVRVRGPRETIIPDLVVYVNGLPLAVIEAKAPGLPDAVDQGVRDFSIYQGQGEFAGRGAPKLFEIAQLHLVIAGSAARYATTRTPARFWADWREPWPLGEAGLSRELERHGGFEHGLRDQERLLYGLLRPENLLELVRSFIVFETERGVRIKKVARYQQFIAVEEAVRRIEEASEAGKRGGVIFHTQGSGKSLTMVFLATRLRRLKSAKNPTLVIVTDRTDLDQQITGTFSHCGFPDPINAESGHHLREVLETGAGPTVMTTIHKFHSAVPDPKDPITTAENVFVLADEAHRTQYNRLAARMRAGLPNACMVAFTGTPIDKRDRSTKRVFGPEIHRYTIDQAVRDGATVEIFYEMRDARLRIEGKDLERALREAYPDLSEEKLKELKKKAPLADLVAGSQKRIEKICPDILAHYRSTIEPNGFKAQIVAVSREAAVTYHETLENLGAPESAVVMSTSKDDTARLRAHRHTPKERERIIERFKEPTDPLKIIVVCDMLLTGFDAPVEQVMYLDAPLREHTLLQAIARVNRTADGPNGPKTHGLVVDYWGDNERIKNALDMFSENDLTGTLLSLSDRVSTMHNRHRTVMRYFDGVDRDDREACLEILGAEDLRAAFDIAYRRFAEAVDMVLPNPQALEEPYHSDLVWLSRLRNEANARYRDDRLAFRHYGAKVRELIEARLSADGVEQLLEPVSMLSPEFSNRLAQLQSDSARASEMEHALRHEIHVHRDENPAAFATLWERLEHLINQRREGRVEAAGLIERLGVLADEVKQAVAGKSTGGSNLTGHAGAVFGLLKADLAQETAEKAAAEIAADLERLAVVDWSQKEDVKRQMRRSIKRALREAGLDRDRVEPLTAKLMDMARARLAS